MSWNYVISSFHNPYVMLYLTDMNPYLKSLEHPLHLQSGGSSLGAPGRHVALCGTSWKIESLRSSIFWHITPCSPLSVNRRFGSTYRLHLQGPKISWAKNSVKADGLLALASTVILGSESQRTHGHILLSDNSGSLQTYFRQREREVESIIRE
jgi:hypothetical protein